MSRRGFAVALASVGGGFGCSATLVDDTPCEAHADCRASFGFGSQCSGDGLCTEPTLHPRCSRATPADLVDEPLAYVDRIVIGSLYSFEDHEDTLLASELAIRQVNALEALDERQFAMIHCDYTPEATDDLDDLEAVAELGPYLADVIGVPLIIGPRGSGRTEATFEAVRDRDTVVISPSATSPALTDLEDPPSDASPGRLWRTAPPDSLQGDVIAADLLERSVLNAAVVYQTGSYGDGLSDLFAARFSQDGGTVALFPFAPGAGFSVTVAQVGQGIAEDKFQEVLFISSDIGDYVAFLRAATASASLRDQFANQLGAEDEGGLFFPDTAFTTQLLDATFETSAELFVKIRGTRPAPAEGVVFNAFAAAYTSTFNQSSTGSAFTPHSYDAAWLGVYAIAWSQLQDGEIDGAGIGLGLRNISAGPPVDILPDSWPLVVDAFAAGTSIDVRGASGQLDYDPVTEETVSAIERWQVTADASTTSGFAFTRIDVIDPAE